MTSKASILIVGATGAVGTQLTAYLAKKNVSFKALTREGAKQTSLIQYKGAEIVYGDLANMNSLKKALEGIKKVFLLTDSSEQAEFLQLNLVKAAKEEGVEHLVKLSQFAADPVSPVRFLRYHAVVEQKIAASGISYTFLRPNLYMQGLLGFRKLISEQGLFFAPIGNARISLIDIRDIAMVAGEVLTGKGHENRIYDLTGPEAITHEEIAACFSEELGRPIRFINVGPDEMYHELIRFGFPQWQAAGLIEDYAHYARGEAAGVSAAVKTITGRSPRNFRTFAQDYASFF